MTPDVIPLEVGLPVALVLWVLVYVQNRRDHR